MGRQTPLRAPGKVRIFRMLLKGMQYVTVTPDSLGDRDWRRLEEAET
jgi:hypothetical protein